MNLHLIGFVLFWSAYGIVLAKEKSNFLARMYNKNLKRTKMKSNFR